MEKAEIIKVAAGVEEVDEQTREKPSKSHHLCSGNGMSASPEPA